MKQFKDPIYGYICIPKEIVSRIIDTPEFQRLRYIKQTSFLPVYSAALHNRFVHSLGVYYLGQKACKALIKNSQEIFSENQIDLKIEKVFELACLLHDVGHAPFSHSGEGFYVDDKKTIYTQLCDTVNTDDFKSDVDYYHSNGQIAAPHEIMSVIVALKRFESFFKDEEERSFFARCITGYKYRDTQNNAKNAILNAFISLLNSTTIDVDRLDYLIRDSFVMGYNSISIDYNRLLNSVTLVKVQNSKDHTPMQLAFRKSALSVIENVIYAHDSEKKWIQNHPVILYEVFLIQQILASVRANYKKRTNIDLFSLDSLLPLETSFESPLYKAAISSFEEISQKILDSKLKDSLSEHLTNIENYLTNSYIPEKITLLCDDDIIHLAKSLNILYSKELFDRSTRHHPIWKSESEYKIYLDGFIGNESYDELQLQISRLNNFLKEEAPTHAINQESIEFCKKTIKKIPTTEGLSEADKEDMNHRYVLILKWLTTFKDIAERQNLQNFDFVLVTSSYFESSFKKTDLSKTPIFFPDTGKTYPLGKLINLFTTKDMERRHFFYVYYKKSANENIDAQDVGKSIAKLVLE